MKANIPQITPQQKAQILGDTTAQTIQLPPLNPSAQKTKEQLEAIYRDGIHLTAQDAVILLCHLEAAEEYLTDVWSVLLPGEQPPFAKMSSLPHGIQPHQPKP